MTDDNTEWKTAEIESPAGGMISYRVEGDGLNRRYVFSLDEAALATWSPDNDGASYGMLMRAAYEQESDPNTRYAAERAEEFVEE